MVKGVVASNRCAAGIRNNPWTKTAGRMDRAWRLGIFKLRVEDDGRARADILDPKLMDDEFQRQLIWLVGFEGESSVSTLDSVNHEADFHSIRWRRSGIPGLRLEC